MRLQYSNRASTKIKSRYKKRVRIRKKIFGDSEKPRLCVFRSAKHIYAQIVDDASGKTIVESSTASLEMSVSKGTKEAAKLVGADIAKKAKGKNITAIVFDRGGYLYHGRIQALAESARESGLQF